ncbi:MAG: serine/threonine-protein kinase [Pirellulaceae bacterium]|nr:serine/threonine-protein kinase [Pirellulaceae bacterium]
MNDSYSNRTNANQQSNELFWKRTEEKVDLLAAAWGSCIAEDAVFPQIGRFVEDVPVEERRLLLHELIKVDLEYRWQDRRAPEYLEFYLRSLPELGRIDELPVDLICEEIQIRMQVGDHVDVATVLERFPTQAAQLGSLLGTMVVPGDRPSGTDHSMEGMLTDGLAETLDRVDPISKRLDQIKEGDTVDDFDLLMTLGQGAFATVYLARQRSLERLVALKISQSAGTEPRTLAQLDHSNIVRVFDQRSGGSSIRLLYMELVAGGTLKDIVDQMSELDRAELCGSVILESVDRRLSSAGTAPPEGSAIRLALRQATWSVAICEIGSRLADGLAYAHEKGVLHRDIKPANILLTSEASPKLADFNISFQAGREDEDPTDTFGGSMAYMSPEQLEACHPALGGSAHRVRESSDIYSLGIVLWELMTGHRPFQDETKQANGWAASLQCMLDRRRDVELEVLIKSLPADCPSSLRDVLRRCLEPDDGRRFQSANQLADALRLCLNPRCWRLLQPPQHWGSRIPLLFPTLTVLLATLLPSLFAALFNFFYNGQRIISQLAGAEDFFLLLATLINAITFSVGISIVIVVAYRCALALKNPPSPRPRAGGSNVMFLGHSMACLALSFWLIAGLAYPISLHLGLNGGVSAGVYVHFALSSALCGILAGTYPFFLVTLLCIRWFIPAMIRGEIIRGPQQNDVLWLRRLNRLYLTLTAFVPLLGILLILLFAQSVGQEAMEDRQFLITASLVGLAGFGLMFWLHRVLDEDLLALQDIGQG